MAGAGDAGRTRASEVEGEAADAWPGFLAGRAGAGLAGLTLRRLPALGDGPAGTSSTQSISASGTSASSTIEPEGSGSVRTRGSSSGNPSGSTATAPDLEDEAGTGGSGKGLRGRTKIPSPQVGQRSGLVSFGPMPLEAVPLRARDAERLGPRRRRGRPPLHHRFGATQQSQRCSTPSMEARIQPRRARPTTIVLSLSTVPIRRSITGSLSARGSIPYPWRGLDLTLMTIDPSGTELFRT